MQFKIFNQDALARVGELHFSRGVIQTPVFIPVGTYGILVTDSAGCTDSIGGIIVLNTNAATIDASALIVGESVCVDDNGSVTGLALVGGTPTFFYSWSNGAQVLSTTLDATGLPSGTYSLIITDQNSCVTTYGPVTINFVGGPTADETAMVITSSTCASNNGSVTGITTTGGTSPFSYDWSNGSVIVGSGLDLLNIQGGAYTLYVTDSNGCKDSVVANIQIIAPPTISAINDAVGVNQDESLTITPAANDFGAANGVSILNGPFNGAASTAGLIVTYMPNAGFYGSDSIQYEICDPTCPLVCDTAWISINVEQVIPLNVPNGFSPNGDGYNDYFVIEGILQYPESEIIIFNRWGDKVFEASPYINNWDGQNMKDENVTDGTYFFVLNINGGGYDPINGFIELRR